MCILLNVKKHEKTFALNVDIFILKKNFKIGLTYMDWDDIIQKLQNKAEYPLSPQRIGRLGLIFKNYT